MALIEELGAVIGQVADAVGDRVVGVGAGWALGSGLLVAPGRVVTNAHNVRGEETAVHFPADGSAAATVAARDLDGDLAVLAVDGADQTAIAWAEAPPRLGAPVVALANPGGRGLRATLGFVSGTERVFRGPRGRRIAGALEHTAPMGRGSSGGPLLDGAGRLVGINTHRLGDGFYLAQPADETLRDRIDALARGDAPRRPRLGVALAPDRAARRLRAAVGLPERDGVLVHAVEEGGPADEAGVRRGDLLVAAGDRPLVRTDDLLDALAAQAPGAPLRLGVIRGDEERTIEVRLAEEGER